MMRVDNLEKKQENEIKSRHNEIKEMRMLNHQRRMLLEKKIERVRRRVRFPTVNQRITSKDSR